MSAVEVFNFDGSVLRQLVHTLRRHRRLSLPTGTRSHRPASYRYGGPIERR
jgi:hypothetical protein